MTNGEQRAPGVERTGLSGQEWEEFTIHKIDIRGRIRKKTLAWASPRAQGSRQRHAITLLGRAWPRIMSMVRFLTPRSFFGSNRRLSSTSSQNGILRVPWPSIFNFLPKRSLIRRKPPRNRETTEDEVFLTRAVLLPLAPGFLSLALEAGLSLPPAKKRPFFNQRSRAGALRFRGGGPKRGHQTYQGGGADPQ